MENSVISKNLLYMGIDYGKKVTGTALFHPSEDDQPYIFESIKYESDQALINKLIQLAKLQNVEAFVLGIPCFEDGQISEMGNRVLKFDQLFKKSTSLPIFHQNEFGSSQLAMEYMQNSPLYSYCVDESKLDSVAAMIILQKFFQG